MTNTDPNAKVILFLGAGASAALGIPTSKNFPKFIESEHRWNTKLIRTICADYLQSMGKGKYTSEEIDAEDLRDWLMIMENVTESLARLKSGSVPPLSKFRGEPSGSFTYVKEIRQQFDQIIRETYKEVSTSIAYQHYDILFRRLWNSGLDTLPIFTTNYDLVLESYAKHSRTSIKLVDGSTPGRSGGEPVMLDTDLFKTSRSTSNTVLFFKLHGSTTWFRHKEKKREVIFLPFGIKPLPDYDYLLIYPTKGKAEILKDYPFNEYYTYLKGYLENESVRLCIVIGYSFGDPAINDLFKTAIKREMRLLIIDPNPNASSLSDKIKLQSGQYTMCKSQFSNKYWNSHMNIALDKELNILSH